MSAVLAMPKAEWTPSMSLAALAIANHADQHGRNAYPSVALIARETGITTRAIQAAVRTLEERGVVRRRLGAGRRGSNLYEIDLEWGRRDPAEHAPAEHAPPQNEHPLPVDSAGGVRGFCGSNGAESAPEPSLEPSGNHPSTTRPDGDEAFEAFWALVPRREGKKSAEKAWRAALRKTPAETLIEGMRVYARSVEKRERRFQLLPASWLNAERWTDEIAGSQAGLEPVAALHADTARKLPAALR